MCVGAKIESEHALRNSIPKIVQNYNSSSTILPIYFLLMSHAIENDARFLDSDSEIGNSDEETAGIRSKASGKVVSIRKIRTSGLCVGEMKKASHVLQI